MGPQTFRSHAGTEAWRGCRWVGLDTGGPSLPVDSVFGYPGGCGHLPGTLHPALDHEGPPSTLLETQLGLSLLVSGGMRPSAASHHWCGHSGSGPLPALSQGASPHLAPPSLAPTCSFADGLLTLLPPDFPRPPTRPLCVPCPRYWRAALPSQPWPGLLCSLCWGNGGPKGVRDSGRSHSHACLAQGTRTLRGWRWR